MALKIVELEYSLTKMNEISLKKMEQIESRLQKIETSFEISEKTNRCLKCLKNQRNLLYLPCCHSAVCNECALDGKFGENSCEICMQPVLGKVVIQK
jgi:hypothetical protein